MSVVVYIPNISSNPGGPDFLYAAPNGISATTFLASNEAITVFSPVDAGGVGVVNSLKRVYTLNDKFFFTGPNTIAPAVSVSRVSDDAINFSDVSGLLIPIGAAVQSMQFVGGKYFAFCNSSTINNGCFSSSDGTSFSSVTLPGTMNGSSAALGTRIILANNVIAAEPPGFISIDGGTSFSTFTYPISARRVSRVVATNSAFLAIGGDDLFNIVSMTSATGETGTWSEPLLMPIASGEATSYAYNPVANIVLAVVSGVCIVYSGGAWSIATPPPFAITVQNAIYSSINAVIYVLGTFGGTGYIFSTVDGSSWTTVFVNASGIGFNNIAAKQGA